MSEVRNNLHDRLRSLAQNLWWTWHPEVISLFTDLDPHLEKPMGLTKFLDGIGGSHVLTF